jgi:cytochrome b561
MQMRNSSSAWGWLSILLHWLAASLIIFLLVHGWWMTHMTARADRVANYSWHAAVGYDVLVLIVLRLLWRWMNPVPELPRDLTRWERIAASASHFSLYVLMFVATLSGWALAGTGRRSYTQDAFGLNFPLIYQSQDPFMHGLLEDTHKILAYALGALVVVHLLAALRHHFIKRNDILKRMVTGQGA